MNRKQRRTARVGDTVGVYLGRARSDNEGYGETVACWLCATPHPASGAARIEYAGTFYDVLVCDDCLTANDIMERLAAKHLGNPKIAFKVRDRIKVTAEQMDALSEKQGKTEQ